MGMKEERPRIGKISITKWQLSGLPIKKGSNLIRGGEE